MNDKVVAEIYVKHFKKLPDTIKRCTVGHGNYVYIIGNGDEKYILRCNEEPEAYTSTMYWLKELAILDIPIPQIIANGISLT